MARKIQHKRGLKQDLPQLSVAEFGFTTDTKELFIGSDDGNVQLASADDLNNIQDILDSHIGIGVNSPDGAHEIRVTLEGVLEYYFEDEWHEISGGGDVAVGTVSDFTASSSEDGRSIKLTWKNPANNEFIKTVVFASGSDISNRKYEDLENSSNKIVDGDIESFSYDTSHGNLTYFKAFAIHDIFGGESISRGVDASALAQDILPPSAITNIETTVYENRVAIGWTNPTDSDFDKVKIVYKTESYPTSQNDGEVGYEGSGNSVEVDSLDNDTVYYFKAFTYDTVGNINNDSTMEFTAEPKEAVNATEFVANTTQDGESIALSWANPGTSTFDSVEVYADKVDLSLKTREQCAQDGVLAYEGSDENSSYDANKGVTYYFKIFVKHMFGDNAVFSTGVATSEEAIDTLPPAPITGISVLEDNEELRLSWVNPTDEDFDKVRIVYKTESSPQDCNDGDMAYEGVGTSVIISNLTNETEYYFRAFTFDTSNNINEDSSMEFTATPQAWDNVEDLLAETSQDGESIVLAWSNPENPDFQGVELYVSTSDLSLKTREQCAQDGSLIGAGDIESQVYDATKNTTYFFKVFAEYYIDDEDKYSSGVHTSEKAVDTKPPAPITNFTVVREDSQAIQLSWTNPTDSDFDKVKIVYKTESYPTSQNDGEVGYEGSGTTATVTGLINDTEYFFRAFAHDDSGNIQTSTTGTQIIGTPSDVKIYGIKIDESNSNPETAVTYTDDATGMTGGSNDWDNVYPYSQIRPVLYKDGQVVGELQKNDFSKLLDGSTADITSGNAGDVMIEFPKIWWKFERIGSDLHVKYATKQVDSTWKAWGHTRGSTEKDFVYIGAYLGYEIDGKLRSVSGYRPTPNKTIGAFRTSAQANGNGYEQMGYYQLLMLQVLYLVRYKNRDSQTALGRGYVDGNSASTETGGADTKGMYFGETTGKQQVKFSGVEDFYGNMFYWIDGLFNDGGRSILIGTEGFNDTGAGYTNYGQGSTANLGGYIGNVQGGTETGFIVKATNGSATTHYADYGYLNAGRLPRFGGNWTNAGAAGAFCLRVFHSASSANSSIGARLLAL